MFYQFLVVFASDVILILRINNLCVNFRNENSFYVNFLFSLTFHKIIKIQWNQDITELQIQQGNINTTIKF